MSNTIKNAAAEAATSTTVQECSQNNSVSTLYMLQRSNGTADSFGTWSGTLLPKSDFIEVAVRFSDLQAAYKNRSAEFTVNLDCVHAYDAHIYKLRAREAEQRREEEERAQRREEERSIIHRITGMDLVEEDLPVFPLEYRREGKDFEMLLDAMQALDDLALERAGLTSWDVDLDELDAEEGDFNDED